MRFRHFASLGVAAMIVAAMLSGCASTSRPAPEYFEPSGAGANIISLPATGPKNAAVIQYGPNAALTIRAAVNEGVASVSMVLTIKSGSSPLTFAGRLVTFEVAGERDEREAMWDASLVDNKRQRTERMPFTAELKPADLLPPAPTEGIIRLGLYQSTLVVPYGFQATKEFRLTVPAATGGAPVTLTFVRRGGKS